MSVGREGPEVTAPAPAPVFGEPTHQLSVAGASDHCVNCSAPLAGDQRYCVNCGERRGKPRFTLAVPHEERAADVRVRTSPVRRRPRTSAAFNLIAGVATLLLAMGVGVLIGHNNSSNNTGGRAPAAQVITVNGGAAAPSSGSTAAAASSGSGGGSKAHAARSRHGGSAKNNAASAPPKVVIQKAAAAASKVTGGSAKVAPATATQGSACTAGTAGCQNGKLTGNYFGQ